VSCLDDAGACPHSYRGLRVVITKARALEPDNQLRLINHYVNDRRYRKDRSVERATSLRSEPTRFRSRWSTVGEFLERGGDCEDYASTKYFLLRELGFPAKHLRIVVSWDRHTRSYHALLAVRRSSDSVWLLDTDNRIYKHRQTTYRFIYAVNENAVWDHDGRAQTASPSDRTTTTKTEAPL
jgi:predicted transglutaminase-like cysteine proteinase